MNMNHPDLVYNIVGGMFDVYNRLKNLWLEDTYEKALIIALEKRKLHVLQQYEYDVFYKGMTMGVYRPDLIVNDTVIIELKAQEKLNRLHQAQLISYLKGLQKPVGILANFGSEDFEYQIVPNKFHSQKVLLDRFDDSILEAKYNDRVIKLYRLANEVLVTLRPGFYREIYHKAYFEELLQNKVPFEMKGKLTAEYEGEIVGEKWVNFFQTFGNILISVVAIKNITPRLARRFYHYIKLMNCKEGVIFNFSGLTLEHKYVKG